MNWLEQKWEYGVREDESIWMSIGDPKTGPHFQFDFHGDEELAKLICSMPAELTRTKKALEVARTEFETLTSVGVWEELYAQHALNLIRKELGE